MDRGILAARRMMAEQQVAASAEQIAARLAIGNEVLGQLRGWSAAAARPEVRQLYLLEGTAAVLMAVAETLAAATVESVAETPAASDAAPTSRRKKAG